MLRPMAPRPPSGMTRRAPSGSGGGGSSSTCAWLKCEASLIGAEGLSRRGGVLWQLVRCVLGGVDQWCAHGPGGQPEGAQAGLDEDGALGPEDAGEQRQQ